MATCKVHYEPLGIYKGNGTKDNLLDGKSFEICADTSNAIRALQLLEAKGVLTAEDLASAVNDETLTFDIERKNIELSISRERKMELRQRLSVSSTIRTEQLTSH